MSKPKKDTILIHPGGEKIPFTKEHAKRIMGISNNGGWKWGESKSNKSQKDAENGKSNKGETSKATK